MTSTSSAAWSLFADLLDPAENPYVRDPLGWVTSTLGEFWWSGQYRMAHSVVENRYSTLDAKRYIGNELIAYGRKPADHDPAAFQGIHARYVLVIIDEAGGVPKSIFDAVDALAPQH